MRYIGKRIIARNGDTALLVNGRIVLAKEKLTNWLYFVDDIKEIDGTYIAERLTPVQTGVMNTTSLTFGDYKIYKRPFYVSEGRFVTNVENINEPYQNKYYGGGTFPVAFIGVEIEGYFPQFKHQSGIDAIDALANELGNKYKVINTSTDSDFSIKSGIYTTREIKYMINRSDLGVLKNLYEELGIRQNYSCGNHVHVSFNSPEYYWLVFSPIFYERFKRAYENYFGKQEKRVKYTLRLSNDYCAYEGMNDIFHDTRYKMINEQSFIKYGTAEFRILPYADDAEEYYQAVKFLVETTEKILNDLVKEQYLERILSDYAIPLVVLDNTATTSIAYDISKYFYPEKDISDYIINSNFAMLYYPEQSRVLFFRYPIFSYLLATKLTGEYKPTRSYYYNMNDILNDLDKYKDVDTFGAY